MKKVEHGEFLFCKNRKLTLKQLNLIYILFYFIVSSEKMCIKSNLCK
jgi:hypothetical protein